MLLTRLLTAAVGIPIVFAFIYCGGIIFCSMMFVISILCVYEYLAISKKYNPHAYMSLLMASIFFVFLYFFKNFPVNKVVISAVIMIFILFSIEIFGKNPNLCIVRISSSFLGAFFIPLSLIHMTYIRDLNCGMELMFFVFVVVWILDTAAYVFGSIFGRHKLAKTISPKKTVEGAMAGIIFGLLAAVIFRYVFMRNILTTWHSIILGFVIAVIGQFSDLAESIVKRDGSLKDSGKIIPGHGGVFDRFDSYMFVTPIVYYIFKFLK